MNEPEDQYPVGENWGFVISGVWELFYCFGIPGESKNRQEEKEKLRLLVEDQERKLSFPLN